MASRCGWDISQKNSLFPKKKSPQEHPTRPRKSCKVSSGASWDVSRITCTVPYWSVLSLDLTLGTGSTSYYGFIKSWTLRSLSAWLWEAIAWPPLEGTLAATAGWYFPLVGMKDLLPEGLRMLYMSRCLDGWGIWKPWLGSHHLTKANPSYFYWTLN